MDQQYITQWMIDGNYMDPPLSEISDKKVKNLVESQQLKESLVIQEQMEVKQAIVLLQKANQHYAAVCDDQGQIKGGVKLKELIFKMKTSACGQNEEVGKVTNMKQKRVSLDDRLDVVLHSIQVHDFVILESDPSIII